MPTMEEWIVVFVVAELAGLALLVALSCWCCRRSVRRDEEEEAAHDLPVTRVVGARQSAAHASARADGGKEVEHAQDHDDDDGDGLVSGGLWGFIAGYPAPNAPSRRTSRASSSQQQQRPPQPLGGVEVVNISVNAAALDEDEDDKALAAAAGGERKSGSAA